MTTPWLGLLAGALTTLAWLPQVVRTWRRRSADDLSWPYLATFGCGILAWLAYGTRARDLAVVVANGATLLLLTGVVAAKAGARRRPRPARGRADEIADDRPVTAGQEGARPPDR